MMSNEEVPGFSRFSSDRAIEGKGEDRLNRTTFAHHLARALCDWKGHDSLVVALYGSWGTGKSSVKNMVLEELRSAPAQAVTIADLNIWELASRDHLSATFLDQLGIALGRGAVETKSDRLALAQRWRAYTAYLTSASDLVRLTQSAAIPAVVVVGVLLVGVSVASAPSFVVRVMAAAMFAVAVLLKWSAGFSQAVTDFLTARAANRKTLREVKDEVQAGLAALDTPLLVVLDDVDRLTPADTVEMLQLVKANADFRGVVYFILCDRDIVERHVEEVLHVSGRDYLEKVVQVAFTMPLIARAQLHAVLFEGLNQTLAESDPSERFDKTRWGNLFHGAIEPYFRTLRDVKRFVATFTFHHSVYRGAGGLEVNPVDLIGLEVLRMFEPDLYRELPQAKSLLTGVEYGSTSRERSEEQRKEAEALVARASESHRKHAQELIVHLFPRAHRHFGGSTYMSGFDEQWFREGRVCAPELFARYFSFAVPAGDISRAVLQRLLAATANRTQLRDELNDLADQGLLPAALARFEAYKEQVPLADTVPFVAAIFDIGDRLERTTGFMLENSPSADATRIVYWHLRKEPDRARRVEYLRDALDATSGLFLPVDFVATLAQQVQKTSTTSPTEEPLIDLAGVESLKQRCLSTVERAAEDGRLVSSDELMSLLFRWRDLAGAEPPRAFCKKTAETPSGAMQLIRGFEQVMTSQAATDYVSRETWYIKLTTMEKFVDPSLLEGALASVDPANLTEVERRAFECFDKALKRRREGKPEFGSRASHFNDED